MDVRSYISRDLTCVITEACRFFPVITLTGPRQSGKTTLLRHLFSELPYVSLETPNMKEFALTDAIGFLKQFPKGAFFDEVQNAPQLLSYIQGLVDSDRDIRFVLSGSSNFSMLKNVTQSLAGRTGVYELLPFSYSEVENIAKNKSIEEIIFNGFYPAIYTEQNVPNILYPSYIKTYLERDVRDLLNIKNMLQFNVFLKLCAGRIGSLFNASELANEVGVDVKTIQAWLSILQTSYIITLLPPYFDNTRKRLTKTPKIYFIDTGLACKLLDIESPEQLARDKMRGALFENLVVVEALKKNYNQGRSNNLYFYRDSNQNEVDLIIKRGNELSCIEIKSSMTYHRDFEKTLKKIDDWVSADVVSKAVVYNGDIENLYSDIKLLNYRSMKELL